MTDYIERDALRDWLKIPAGDKTMDAFLTLAITAASRSVDDFTGRVFGPVASSAARIFEAGRCRFFTDDFTAVSLVEHSTDRVTWTTVTGWWALPDNVSPKYRIEAPTTFSRWGRVTATYGYGSIPAQAEEATMLKAARLYERRKSTTGVIGITDFGEVRISRQSDPDCVELLTPLQRVDGMIA